MYKQKKNVAILTTFQEFTPGYSLTGIVIEQAHMLARHGHKVVIIVNEQFNDNSLDNVDLNQVMEMYPDHITIEKSCKNIRLTDYTEDKLSETHEKESMEAGDRLAKCFVDNDIDIAFTHDYIFTGWNLPYYHALVTCNAILNAQQLNCQWYHWIHSVPSGRKSWWNLDPLGVNHNIVFPNKTEVQRVAESWRVVPVRVKTIPHIKDIRNWYDFGSESRELIDKFPKMMSSPLVQVYPCSTDRMAAKQLDIVIKLFGYFKMESKADVFLCIANQWATGRARKEDVEEYVNLASEHGLIYGEDFCFTSKENKKWQKGINKRMLRELQLLSSIFLFPTMEESFGLVGPEASFSGSLVVLNRSLPMMMEVMSNHPPAFEFSSFCNNAPISKDSIYLSNVARAILNRFYSQESVVTKAWTRMRYNMDNLYYRYYLPIL